MQLLRISSFVAAAIMVSNSITAQTLVDKETLKINDSVTLHVGNDIIINKPSGFDFANVEEQKSGLGLAKIGKIANVGAAAGSTIFGVGASTSSIGAMQAGAKVAQTASVASSAGWTADAINSLNASEKAKSIVGKKMRILKFKKEGNEKRGEHVFAIVAGPGKTDYRIEIQPALATNEITVAQ